jgi:hypothetical protein
MYNGSSLETFWIPDLIHTNIIIIIIIIIITRHGSGIDRPVCGLT